MSLDEYQNGNFLIVENLKRKNLFSGQLSAHLKFKNILTNKLYFLMIPVYQKQLKFDESFGPSISDMHPVAADRTFDNADRE